MNMYRLVSTVAAVAVLVAGCSLFAPEKPEGTRPVASEGLERPMSEADAQRQSDVDSCRQQADAVLSQEQAITADINSRESLGAFQDDAPELTQNMDEWEARQRSRRVFEECMIARGYAPETE